MRDGWQTRTLGEVCDLITRGIAPKYIESDGICVLNQKCIREHVINYDFARRHDAAGKTVNPDRLIQFGDVLINSTGTGTLGRVAQVREPPIEPTTVDAHVTIVRPKAQKFYLEFFGYMLIHIEEEIKSSGEGASGQTELARNIIENRFKVSFPSSLTEQKRIVAILDEAFEGIATATFNTKKNLANARELFESYLNSIFTTKGEDWVQKPIERVATKIGSGATPKGGYESYKTEGISLIRSLNVHDRKFKYDDLAFLDDEQAGKLNNVAVQKGDVLLNITGASVARCSKVPDEVLPARVNQHVSIIRPIQNVIETNFLEYALTARINKDRLLGVGEKAGATRQAITKAQIQEFELSFPPLDAQTALCSQLDELGIEASRLANIYRRKLAALAELKQSILQKAFAGELTAEETAKTDPRTPEFTAYVLAFSYDQHLLKRHEKTFGHVKAQKTLHLFESIAGIDLGRNPIKDAAGPNDFQHMLRAERWAKDNQFFTFVGSKDKGYEFKKLTRYNEMIEQCSDAIKPYNEQLKKVIDLVLPMNSRDAEIFATVHAAWNNLIIDQIETTDQNIIREARENWHAEKLRIPEKEFKDAIRFIRDKGLVPDGTAKRVAGQDSLL